ncbi:hypothetical protein Tco_0747045 [Tanacetum coccineum]
MPKVSATPYDPISKAKFKQKDIFFKMMQKSKSYEKHQAHRALYDALMLSMILDEDDLDKMFRDQPKQKKRDHGDDKDKDPSAGPNQGKKTKRRRTKESESSKKSSTSKGNSSPKTLKSDKLVHAEELSAIPIEEVIMDVANDNVIENGTKEKQLMIVKSTHGSMICYLLKKGPLTFNEVMATPIDLSKFAMNRLKIDKLTKAHLAGPVYNLLKGTCQRDRCPFDLSKPLPLKGLLGHLTVPLEYFFNNDLEYLKSSDTEKKYTMSITKTKAARYELVGIEDMIPSLWSVAKVGFDKDVERGIKHWGSKRQLFYRSQLNRFSKHDVYPHLKILSVKSVKVNKLHGYGYLEEIMVRRADRQLYKFKEGDFVNLQLNDIEDMLLLIVGVESYQKKLNITKPQKDFPGISAKELYTPSFDPPGVVYEGLNKQKRVMRADELYKFSSYQNQRDLPRDIPLDRIEFLRYDTKGVKVRNGIMQTKTELTLEQTQQGVSDEFLVSIEGVEE